MKVLFKVTTNWAGGEGEEVVILPDGLSELDIITELDCWAFDLVAPKASYSIVDSSESFTEVEFQLTTNWAGCEESEVFIFEENATEDEIMPELNEWANEIGFLFTSYEILDEEEEQL